MNKRKNKVGIKSTYLSVALFIVASALSFSSCMSMYVNSSEMHNKSVPMLYTPEEIGKTEYSIGINAAGASSDPFLRYQEISPDNGELMYADYYGQAGISFLIAKRFSEKNTGILGLNANGFLSSLAINKDGTRIDSSAWGANIQIDAMLFSHVWPDIVSLSIGPSLIWSMEGGDWPRRRQELTENPELNSGYNDYNLCPSGHSLSLNLGTEILFPINKKIHWGWGSSIGILLHDAASFFPVFITFFRSSSTPSVLESPFTMLRPTVSGHVVLRIDKAQYWINGTIPSDIFMGFVLGPAAYPKASFGFGASYFF